MDSKNYMICYNGKVVLVVMNYFHFGILQLSVLLNYRSKEEKLALENTRTTMR